MAPPLSVCTRVALVLALTGVIGPTLADLLAMGDREFWHFYCSGGYWAEYVKESWPVEPLVPTPCTPTEWSSFYDDNPTSGGPAP